MQWVLVLGGAFAIVCLLIVVMKATKLPKQVLAFKAQYVGPDPYYRNKIAMVWRSTDDEYCVFADFGDGKWIVFHESDWRYLP